jgi:hypothetical protein
VYLSDRVIVIHSYNGIQGWKTTYFMGAQGRCSYAQSKNLSATKYIQDERMYYYSYDGNGYLKSVQPEVDGGGVPNGNDPSLPGYFFSFSGDGVLQSIWYHENGIHKMAFFTYTGSNSTPLENVGGLNQVLHLNEKHYVMGAYNPDPIDFFLPIYGKKNKYLVSGCKLDSREGVGDWVTVKNVSFTYELDADGYVKKISPNNLPANTRTPFDLYTYLKTEMTLNP